MLYFNLNKKYEDYYSKIKRVYKYEIYFYKTFG